MRVTDVLILVPLFACAASDDPRAELSTQVAAVDSCAEVVIPYAHPPFSANRVWIFWANGLRGPGLDETDLFRVPRGGGRIAQIGEAADSHGRAEADGLGAYFITPANSFGASAATYVFRDGTATGGRVLGRAVAQAGSNALFWSSWGRPLDQPDDLQSAPRDALAGEARLVLTSIGHIDDFALGETYVYTAETDLTSSSSAIYKTQKVGGTHRRLYAPAGAGVRDVEIVHGVLWVTHEDGSVATVNAATGVVKPLLVVDAANFVLLPGPDTAYLAVYRPFPAVDVVDVSRIDPVTGALTPVPYLQGVGQVQLDEHGAVYWRDGFLRSRACPTAGSWQ